MARYRGSVCRFCRREGVKLFLKGVRCLSTKCAIDRRSYPPGQHGQNRAKISDYGLQLREKQKVKRIFGVLEKQFRNAFERASRKKGITGESLLTGLELRLDSVVYRMGLGTSRNEARMLVTHGHLEVNGRKVDIPSFQCKVSDVVMLRLKSQANDRFKENLRDAENRGVVPSWLDIQRDQFKAIIREQPKREEIHILISENLIVELYSR